MEPAQLVLKYVIPGDGSGTNTVVLDLARDLSAVNRRLYRQGYVYAVAKVVFLSPAHVTQIVGVATAGNTWMVHNAWTKGYALWKEQQQDVAEVMPSIEGKWQDFKVKLDDSGVSYLPCVATDGGAMTPDEWNYSNYVWDDDGTERLPAFHIIGGTDLTSSIGLVQEYHISRAQPALSPIVDADASDSVYAKSLGTDEFSDMLVGNVEDENDNSPYDHSEMPGGDTVADEPWLQELAFGNSDAGQLGQIGAFAAECGLIKIQAISTVGRVDDAFSGFGNAVSAECNILVHLVPGPYRGVLAERMGQ